MRVVKTTFNVVSLTVIGLVTLYAVLGVAGGSLGYSGGIGSYEALTVYTGR